MSTPEPTHLSKARFPSSPSALAVYLGSGFGAAGGVGAAAGAGSGGATLVTAGASESFLVSAGVESPGGAEIRALIWRREEKTKQEAGGRPIRGQKTNQSEIRLMTSDWFKVVPNHFKLILRSEMNGPISELF